MGKNGVTENGVFRFYVLRNWVSAASPPAILGQWLEHFVGLAGWKMVGGDWRAFLAILERVRGKGDAMAGFGWTDG